VRFVYEWRVLVRTLVSLGLVSFSFFGFLFGSRALRFFIAWTYITVIPAALIAGSGEWLNVRSLYLAAVGFCVILAAGTLGCVRLLGAHRHRRWLPFAIPLFFVAVALTVNIRLAARNSARSLEPDIRELHRVLEAEIAASGREAAPSGPRAPAPPFHDDRPGR
jgi:Kef-type K+ transport system membrane component KefB